MNGILLRIATGAFLPSVATIIFNMLNFVFENYEKRPRPPVSESTFDIAAGCAFSIIGICVAVKNNQTILELLVAFVGLMLFLIFGDMLALLFLGWNKALMVVVVNIVSFGTLSWAIVKAKQEA